MAIDSMFLRLVGGNTSAPIITDRKLSAHDFIAALQMWSNGEITKQHFVDAYDFTHGDDSGDLDNLKQWHQTAKLAGLGSTFSDIVEWRLILARDKRTAVPGIIDMNSKFGYAIKNTFIQGADGVHSLRDSGPTEERFVTWAS